MRRRGAFFCRATLMLFAAAQPIDAQTILGRVVDERSVEPLTGALVTLLDSTGVAAQSAVTDHDGRFRLSIAPGSYAFAVRRLGYAPFTSAVLTVAPDVGEVNVTIAVPVREVVLDPVTVEGEAPPFAPGPLEDFERRRARGLGGFFVTQEDIERINPSYPHEVFYGIPSVRVSRYGGGTYTVRITGKALPFEPPEEDWDGNRIPPCPPTLYVDGIKTQGIDNTLPYLPVSDFYAVEVYRRASETPAEFLDSDSRCGVIVIWTKRSPSQRPG